MRTPEQMLRDALDIVAGGRDPDARRALVAELARAPDLAAAVAAIERALEPMARSGADVQPPPGLFARIEAVLDAEARIATYARDIRLDDAGWVEVVPGVRKRILWDEQTFLAQVQPGHAFPEHDHPWTEHCLVISGDMVVDGVVYRAGDYHAPAKGSRHGDLATRTGLLVLVRREP